MYNTFTIKHHRLVRTMLRSNIIVIRVVIPDGLLANMDLIRDINRRNHLINQIAGSNGKSIIERDTKPHNLCRTGCTRKSTIERLKEIHHGGLLVPLHQYMALGKYCPSRKRHQLIVTLALMENDTNACRIENTRTCGIGIHVVQTLSAATGADNIIRCFAKRIE